MKEKAANVTFRGSSAQSVTFVWILIRTNIRIYSYWENDTNEYPNIFVWKFLARTNIRIYSYQNFDTNECPQKIFGSEIFEYSNIFVILWTRLAPILCFYNLNSIFYHCYQQNIHKQSVISIEIKQKHRRNLKIDTNEYPNIFVSKYCYERISEYIRIQKVDTNE